MTNPVLEVTANPPLPLSSTTTSYSGAVRLGSEGGLGSRAGQPPQEYGFFLPDAPPWDGTAEPPQVWAEAHLMLLRMVDTRFDMGVERVTAGYLADPRGGPARWLHCSLLAYAPYPLRVSYRVIVTTMNASAGPPAG